MPDTNPNILENQDRPFYYADPTAYNTKAPHTPKPELIWQGLNKAGKTYRVVYLPSKVGSAVGDVVIERLDGKDSLDNERWIAESTIPWIILCEFTRIAMRNKDLKLNEKI
jgi:hypothetical protein